MLNHYMCRPEPAQNVSYFTTTPGHAYRQVRRRRRVARGHLSIRSHRNVDSPDPVRVARARKAGVFEPDALATDGRRTAHDPSFRSAPTRRKTPPEPINGIPAMTAVTFRRWRLVICHSCKARFTCDRWVVDVKRGSHVIAEWWTLWTGVV